MTTEIIIEKRSLNRNEFTYSPLTSLNFRQLKRLFDYIEQNSNLKIIDISSRTTGSQGHRLCFKVVDKTCLEQIDKDVIDEMEFDD